FLGHAALVVEESASNVMRWSCSNRHVPSQPSRFVVLPSSHCSPASRTPFPHTAASVVVDVVVIVVVVVVVVVPALQVPPPHVKPGAQSAPLMQPVLQLVAPQAYGEQDDAAPGVQSPAPSQVLALVCAPPVHDGAAQTVLAG